MSDLNTIQVFSGDLEPSTILTGDLEAIDFFPHLLEDSSGDLIVDSDGNILTDATPAPAEPLNGEFTALVVFTGELEV